MISLLEKKFLNDEKYFEKTNVNQINRTLEDFQKHSKNNTLKSNMSNNLQEIGNEIFEISNIKNDTKDYKDYIDNYQVKNVTYDENDFLFSNSSSCRSNYQNSDGKNKHYNFSIITSISRNQNDKTKNRSSNNSFDNFLYNYTTEKQFVVNQTHDTEEKNKNESIYLRYTILSDNPSAIARRAKKKGR